MLTPDLLGYILADSRAEVLVVSAPLLDAAGPALAALPALRLAVVAAPDGSEPDAGPHVSLATFLTSGSAGFETS